MSQHRRADRIPVFEQADDTRHGSDLTVLHLFRQLSGIVREE
jgi:hypothetical protein